MFTLTATTNSTTSTTTSTAITLPSSPPSPPGKKSLVGASPENSLGLLLVPIELCNGCTEEGCSIESDDIHLTNIIRKHYLEHFGHRDLNGIVSDYYHHADNTNNGTTSAFMIQVVNGTRTKFHGLDEIRQAWQDIFKSHPTVNSTFTLKHITIHDRNAMVIWSAKTPTHVFPQCSDTFLFHPTNGTIVKHFFSCQMNALEHPWYIDDE